MGLTRIEFAYECGRTRTHDPQERSDRLQDAGDSPKSERSGAKRRDLAIAPIDERANQVDGIARRILAVVLLVEEIERPRETCRVASQNVVIGSPARHIGQSAAG
jgi:hypothetical protein